MVSQDLVVLRVMTVPEALQVTKVMLVIVVWMAKKVIWVLRARGVQLV